MNKDDMIKEKLANTRLYIAIFYSALLTGFFILYQGMPDTLSILGITIKIYPWNLIIIGGFALFFAYCTYRYINENKKLMEQLEEPRE